jgi:3-isopropylmalate dehydrogenase
MEGKIVLLPGDGIGVEVVEVARATLDAVAQRHGHQWTFEERLIGGCAIDLEGVPLSDSTLAACRDADAVLMGAVGGPKWDGPDRSIRPEQGLLKLRQSLGLYANLRPVRVFPQLADASPLRPERVRDVDILFVRELTGGLYFGEPRCRETIDGYVQAIDTLAYNELEIRRVIRLACTLARQRRGLVTSIDKANILETSRLWREIANEVADEFSDIHLEHQLVDSAAMRLIQGASELDVLVTSNMFGDILSDEASVLTGSLGMLPSASLGEGNLGVYEPVHGSAPDITGKGVANPIGATLSAAMLLRHSFGLEVEAHEIERAVERTLAAGYRTPDLTTDSPVSTETFGEALVKNLSD